VIVDWKNGLIGRVGLGWDGSGWDGSGWAGRAAAPAAPPKWPYRLPDARGRRSVIYRVRTKRSAIMSGEVTAQKHRGLAPAWKPGNPLGRPKGSRSKFGEAFLEDLYADWQAHGAEVIPRVRVEHPDCHLRVCASILPKQSDIKPTDFREFTDVELERYLCEEFRSWTKGMSSRLRA
jgi:hypothetical protein